ncbi:putative UDP-glucose flavonoid 3-O-glucosyltransferase 3 [Humulus lupulus]|uniref:putative UDP-glucose flavonoid 3-O-glucosyltransferase 3 n=1 Tax=Humulus lupulus TaxID=3486 RepID=UPI002B415177|nr:putative UDP-glucose flavonoid 3-O-glucosyltransferase 3 [Humulus lupulus]
MDRKMKKGELVFIPFPDIGHIVPLLEMAKILVARDQRLSISILIMKFPGSEPTSQSYVQSLIASISVERIKFIKLSEAQNVDRTSSDPIQLITSFFENIKPHVRNAVKILTESFPGQPDSPTLAGIVVDMFCTTLVDVICEFGIPTYMFFTCGAGYLRLVSHLENLSTDQNKDITEYKDEPDAELVVKGFLNTVPVKVFPDVLLDKVLCPFAFSQHRNATKLNGILVNTFMELEYTIIDSLTKDNSIPPIYPVGPIISPNPSQGQKETEIVTWLDMQPPSSVVFLCFGSRGNFNGEQVKEIAMGLELCGVRFLWSLRKQGGQSTEPEEYTDFNEALPEGFLDRTAEIGKVIGWAPQMTVLAHSSVGGFVSHCGWNSILESLWYGVPMATWPVYAEQQLNAFELVKEFRLAVEIKLDYRSGLNVSGDVVMVKAEEIEVGIRKVMESDNDIRKRVKEMSEKGRKTLMEGGSSYSSLSRFIDDVILNIS